MFKKEGTVTKSPNSWSFDGNSASELYHSMTATIMDKGKMTSPRGQTTFELQRCTTTLSDPRKRVLSVPGRRINPFFQLAECVWILYGSGSVSWLTHYNKSIQSIAEPGASDFEGAYGPRIQCHDQQDQLQDIICALREDCDSRRAYVAIWNPFLDNARKSSKDKPCNVGFTAKIRDGKLDLTVMNRSNDAVLGLTSVNITQFTTIQEVLSRSLGVDVGVYCHFSDSLHIYTKNSFGGPSYEKIKEETDKRYPFNIYDFVTPVRMGWSCQWGGPGTFKSLFDLGDWRHPDVLEFKFRKAIDQWGMDDYWSSVAYALMAWNVKVIGGSFETVASLISKMEAQDWAIECLRFMVRAYKVTSQEEVMPHVQNIFGDRLSYDDIYHGPFRYIMEWDEFIPVKFKVRENV